LIKNCLPFPIEIGYYISGRYLNQKSGKYIKQKLAQSKELLIDNIYGKLEICLSIDGFHKFKDCVIYNSENQ
jgi:hypothetical protein